MLKSVEDVSLSLMSFLTTASDGLTLTMVVGLAATIFFFLFYFVKIAPKSIASQDYLSFSSSKARYVIGLGLGGSSSLVSSV